MSHAANDFASHPAGYYVAFVLWIVSAIVSTCYTFTWDIKMDWGLFEGRYKLRSELIYRHKVRGLCPYQLQLFNKMYSQVILVS